MGRVAYTILASIVSHLGRWENGIAFGLKAIRLNPVPELGNFIVLGCAHFMIGQYEEAIRWLKRRYMLTLTSCQDALFSLLVIAH
jgi:hypothetical protein